MVSHVDAMSENNKKKFEDRHRSRARLVASQQKVKFTHMGKSYDKSGIRTHALSDHGIFG